jgi:hypothetical protein
MANDLETDTVKQSSVLRWGKARVIQGLVLEGERACTLAMSGSGVKHERGIVFCVGIEHREHRSLRLVRKVEVAVPSKIPRRSSERTRFRSK